MTLRVSRNMGPYGTVPLGIYDWKEFLKATGGTKNWSVVMSGDGLAAFSGTGDVITSGANGANGLDNSGAWFVLEDPDSNRQILVQRDTVAYRFEYWYSKGKLFTGGSAATRATATDEKSFMQNRLANYTTYPSTGISFYMHIVAEGDTPEGNVYPFWCVMRFTATGNPFGVIMMDCVDDSLSPAADSDKAILMTAANQNLFYNSGAIVGNDTVSSYPSAYMRYGQVNEEWNAIAYMAYWASVVRVPAGLAANPEDSKFAVLPCFVARTSGVTNGIKGQSHLMRYRPTGFSYGDVVFDGTDYFLVVDDFMMRGWPDSTGPTI
jgi:hypothetical protein